MQIEMTIKGLMIDPVTNMPIVVLRDLAGERVLPIWVGVFEANAIALQMEGITTPRPMTHDLLKNVITQIEGDVLRVVINNLKENTFYAQIHLRVANREVLVDSRPSDAIALALRVAAPVFVEESVLEKSRSGEDTSDAQNSERLRKWLEEADPDTLGKYRM